MISNGNWKKSNVTNYISCDAYNGDNTPKRYGLVLKMAFNIVSLETSLKKYIFSVIKITKFKFKSDF